MKFLKLLITFLILGSVTVVAQKTDSTYSFKTSSVNGTGKFYMGREIAKVMSFEGVDWLERYTRSKEENTDLAISKMPIHNKSIIADIGAGSGFYTFRLSPKVNLGKIYAIEIQDDALVYIKQKSKDLNARNVIVNKGTEKSPNLPSNSIDLAIMVDVYHELLYPKEYLQALKSALKSKGKLLLLEYKEEDPQVEIKKEHKMSVKQVEKELGANGFRLVQNGQFMPLQHFLIFEKL